MRTVPKQTNEKAVMWLIEVAFRMAAGLILWIRFSDLLVLAVATYLLGTAGLIIITNFIKAQRAQ